MSTSSTTPNAGLGRQPLIAVTGRWLPADEHSRWSNDAVASPRPYLDSVARAGGIPVVLMPDGVGDSITAAGPVDFAALAARFDGVVMSGGPDVDPSYYGEAAHAETYGVEPRVDAFEIGLVQAAIAADIPVLAICRGIQVLNVARGGSLQQHLPDLPHSQLHGIPKKGGGILHPVRVEPGTKLAKALGHDRPDTHSQHHQGLDRLGAGLVAVGWADDGLVEAIELDTGWVVGVQWHPEQTAATDPVQQALFDAFVEVAAGR